MVDPEFVHRPRSLRHDLSEAIPRNEPTPTHPRSDSLLPIRFRLDVGFLEKPRNWNGLCDLGSRRNGTHCDHWDRLLWRKYRLGKDPGAGSSNRRRGSS